MLLSIIKYEIRCKLLTLWGTICAVLIVKPIDKIPCLALFVVRARRSIAPEDLDRFIYTPSSELRHGTVQ